ncbi:MAG TPA: substrate-binding domain-containing protein [Bryobacteraceae bacterium]|nr:substrate-binding domain-containing protein [Bryobacteraceae bacterium]
MRHPRPPEIENRLAALRQSRGASAAWLAKAAGVSRQTIYAIEAGTFIPNTAVALRLARALETGVEDLFTLGEDASTPDLPSAEAKLLPGSGPLEPGQPVQLCRVEERLMASAPSPVPWYLPAGDALVTGNPAEGRKAKVRIYHPDGDFRNRILVAGCDPGISVLARHMQPAGVELVLAHRNSSQALLLLKQGVVHIAGTHLRDERSGESNLPEVGRIFGKNRVAVISFAVWEEGILMARGNPKAIRGMEDLARRDVRLVNREEGSGSRRLLDSHLDRLKIDRAAVTGYQNLASGHLAAAWQVRIGAADCCIATRAAARLLGLGFQALASERYDLVIRRQHLDFPPVQALLDTLNRSSFRRELESAGGYDTRAAGQRML